MVHLVVKLIVVTIIISMSAFIFTSQDNNKEEFNQRQNENISSGLAIHNYDSHKKSITEYFTKIPERVIVVNANELNTMLALGLGDKIVDAVIDTNSIQYQEMALRYPEEIKKVKNFSKYQLSKEQAIADGPDFILGWKSTFNEKYLGSTDWWNKHGVKTYIVPSSNKLLPKATIATECNYILDIGKIFHVENRANDYVNKINSIIAIDKKIIECFPRQQVMVIEMTDKYLWNYDDGWLVGDMVEQLGGIMPVKDKNLSQEELIIYNPDVIFMVTFNNSTNIGFNKMTEDPRFSSMKAVQNHRIYQIRLDQMYSTSVKTIDGLQIIKQGLYPQLEYKS